MADVELMGFRIFYNPQLLFLLKNDDSKPEVISLKEMLMTQWAKRLRWTCLHTDCMQHLQVTSFLWRELCQNENDAAVIGHFKCTSIVRFSLYLYYIYFSSITSENPPERSSTSNFYYIEKVVSVARVRAPTCDLLVVILWFRRKKRNHQRCWLRRFYVF